MKGSISISEKAVLSIIEASEYSEIGQDRLKSFVISRIVRFPLE